MLEEHTATLSDIVEQTVKDAVEKATRNLAPATRHVVQDESRRLRVSGISLGRFREYDGRAVPSDFVLPSVDLRTAWDFYLRGFPSNRSTSSGQPTIAPVRPLRYITASNSASMLRLGTNLNRGILLFLPMITGIRPDKCVHLPGVRRSNN